MTTAEVVALAIGMFAGGMAFGMFIMAALTVAADRSDDNE